MDQTTSITNVIVFIHFSSPGLPSASVFSGQNWNFDSIFHSRRKNLLSPISEEGNGQFSEIDTTGVIFVGDMVARVADHFFPWCAVIPQSREMIR